VTKTTIASFSAVFYCEKVIVKAGEGANNDPEDRICHTQLALSSLDESVECSKCGTRYSAHINLSSGKGDDDEPTAHDSYGNPVEVEDTKAPPPYADTKEEKPKEEKPKAETAKEEKETEPEAKKEPEKAGFNFGKK